MYERYERIVKSLRSCMRLEEPAFECIEMDGGCCDSIGRCIPHLMDDAANAIEELQRTQMPSTKWIPVTERLPDYPGRFLCYYEIDDYGEIGHCIDWGRYDPDDGWYVSGVTNWMLLPEPPEEKDDR